MKAHWAGLALAAVLAVGGCGEGRVIFNVDVFSFLTGQQSIPYAIPDLGPGTESGSFSNVPRKVSLFGGAGNSVVENVLVTDSVDFVNQSGAGTIGFQVYIAADSAGTYNSSALAVNLPPTSVSGTNTSRAGAPVDLSSTFNALFTQRQLWFRVVASGANTGSGTVQGNMVLTYLTLTVVIQDDF